LALPEPSNGHGPHPTGYHSAAGFRSTAQNAAASGPEQNTNPKPFRESSPAPEANPASGQKPEPSVQYPPPSAQLPEPAIKNLKGSGTETCAERHR